MKLTLWVSNMSDFGADADYTRNYLDAANAASVLASHPTVTLSGQAISATDPDELWAAYCDLRTAVGEIGHGTDDAEAERRNPPRLAAVLDGACGAGRELQVIFSFESATWQDYRREALVTDQL